MALNKWRRVKPLVNQNAVNVFEKKYNLSLPDDFKKCVIENNGGRPEPNSIKTKNGYELDVKLLLSYNVDDTENIYAVIDYFMDNYAGKLIPFASDSAGNYYCFKGDMVFLWTQENEIISVCDSFMDFKNGLYKD